jgi:hypothetical protein
MVKHYADNADRVIVMVSPKPRQTPSGKDITQENSIDVWNHYFDVMNLNNVEAIPSPHPSPVRSAYVYVEEDAKPGELVILGTSTKGGDQSRFAKNVQQYAKEGVTVLDPMKFAFDPVGEELSATDFRAGLETGDVAKFMPRGVNPENVLDILDVESETEEVTEHIALPLFFRLIEEALDERDYQKDSERIKKHSSMRMSTKGKPNKAAPFDIDPPKARSKSAPPGFGGALEEAHRISEGIEEETWYHASEEPIMDKLEPMYLVNIDTLGLMKHRWDDFTYRNIDVVWDIPDYKQGYERIFVVNPEALEPAEMELGEISSMGGGSVAGYSLPLGAQKRKGKKKKVYMEPHMHQD